MERSCQSACGQVLRLASCIESCRCFAPGGHDQKRACVSRGRLKCMGKGPPPISVLAEFREQGNVCSQVRCPPFLEDSQFNWAAVTGGPGGRAFVAVGLLWQGDTAAPFTLSPQSRTYVARERSSVTSLCSCKPNLSSSGKGIFQNVVCLSLGV